MSTQNLYEARFEKFIEQYFSTHDVPDIHGYMITNEISDETIDAELLKTRLRNTFKEMLAQYTFSDKYNPNFEEIAIDALNEFLESTIRTFELHEPREKEKLEMVFHDLSVAMLGNVLDEMNEIKRKRDAGYEGKILPFKGPEGTPSKKK